MVDIRIGQHHARAGLALNQRPKLVDVKCECSVRLVSLIRVIPTQHALQILITLESDAQLGKYRSNTVTSQLGRRQHVVVCRISFVERGRLRCRGKYMIQYTSKRLRLMIIAGLAVVE